MSTLLHPVPPDPLETGANNRAHHHHAHGHAEGHDHRHHPPHGPARKVSGLSLIALSGWARLGLALPVLATLWLLTFWAMANG